MMFELDKTTKQRLMPLYLETDYHIPSLKTSLSIGQRNSKVDQWLGKHGATHAVFITAFNPNSKAIDLILNQKRNVELAQQLDSLTLLKGSGVPHSAGWIPEESFLVMDLAKDLTLDLMCQFEQIAVVWHQMGEVTNLLWRDLTWGFEDLEEIAG